ncbi:MAG: hydrogenobyrinic acid a,c-diamide synthase (glutamine-hydrolyzing) [Candidatus Thiodiazotropha lotti]|nr:hydrogenobyrinic acid a,c-diamide synthase (glutamine-hydrolyzing) [Candidatus Thiodiazotropha lotti]MCG7930225.1 hydrogenobyrinic acid a,c-diamide synthase (glutamine-hydrolyzing) [Candidatus Thiodiazotropha lotti]MCG8004990.1 hydrogenobyrinic acid a,c-diamide synthase (glutamine-hydrolyzing) [Candidatus Thiodiazotropha lotti]MCG8006481.1 hydrogenobyrinic acid a,c-diamide synthase (glutamine-hydrolyzing) [Candidatus Thiodiazotropha lotti]MCW4188617.1 hydrogenobyrinic acid a,c-diamide syntha
MPSIYISAAHKSSGKTTLSIGLVRALVDRGLQVQPFKKGPDYIDPLWLSAAAGRACYNLDFYTQSRDEITERYINQQQDCDLVLIEGNKGLYDGVDVAGSNSNAAMAVHLGTPVVLVINCRGMTRGIAPLLLGYQAFDRNIRIAGVILNQVGGSRHQSKLIQVVEHYTDIPVLGAVQADPELQIVERHLGLIPSNEELSSEKLINKLAETAKTNVDLDRFLEIANGAESIGSASTQNPLKSDRPYQGLKIGLARDEAFGFYYPDDLDRFLELGAELLEFNTLKDRELPDVDGIFLGGGFPETTMEKIESNPDMQQAIVGFIERGGPVYAECGGLIYLTRSLSWQGKKCRMAGVIPADTVMHEKPQGRGYVRLSETGRSPWPNLGVGHKEIFAHEFHYSSLVGLKAQQDDYAYRVERGYGIDGKNDGYVYKNLLASYTHRRSVGGNNWVARFLALVASVKNV